ncbi:hypothetical protein ENUP19_0072G0011 [Entamoeba nuttalli]|uniref:Uncharacterized protein n=1 Tax=Entamoeba nuttalli TaxID=412467 RepID=A0ABQ0DEF7_9EUKA
MGSDISENNGMYKFINTYKRVKVLHSEIQKRHTYCLRCNPLKRNPKPVQGSLKSHASKLLKISINIIKIFNELKTDLIQLNSSIKSYDRCEYVNFLNDISKLIKLFYNINNYITRNNDFMTSKVLNECLKILIIDEDIWMKYPLMEFLSIYVIIMIDIINDDDKLLLENMQMITKLLNKWNQIQKRNNSNEEIDLSLLDLSEP